YLDSNGVDSEGKPINSSAYFFESSNHFARSRFPYIVPKLEEFTAKNLEAAVAKAIELEEKEKGIKAVDFVVNTEKKEELSFDEAKQEIIKFGKLVASAGKAEKVSEAISEYVGA